jgi:hypothetical protein
VLSFCVWTLLFFCIFSLLRVRLVWVEKVG